MLMMETKGDMQHLEFDIPSRGLIGLAYTNAYQYSRRSSNEHIALANTSHGKDQFPEEAMVC